MATLKTSIHVESNSRQITQILQNGEQGKVMVEIIIDAQGYVVEAIVLNEVDHLLDMEALRVIYNSPRWKPAKHEGRAVPVSCVFPVQFKLR